MSQQWQTPSRTGGSVRRARERIAAGLPPEAPPPQPPQQRPYEYEPPRANPSPPRVRPQAPSAFATRGQGPIGVAISRPTQVPQWPLMGTIEGSPEAYEPPANRGPPPQRPPRPSHVPSMLDASRLQDHTPSFQYAPNTALVEQGQSRMRFQDDDFDVASPSTNSPRTPLSRSSTLSSVGSIPDFPLPIPGPPRRSANLGPPPSARRGASSYYSQTSFVSPIPEVSESPRTLPGSHGSYASSAAIPSSWGTGSPGYRSEEDEEYEYSPNEMRFPIDTVEEGRESRESNLDDNDDQGLIRSASVGKRAKPSMITTRTASSERINPDQLRPDELPMQGVPKFERMGFPDGSLPGKQVEVMKEDALANGTGLIDNSSSSEYSSPMTIGRALTADEAAAYPPNSADANAMLGAYQAASALPGDITRSKSPGDVAAVGPAGGKFSRLSVFRRPPPARLDMDAVRDAEARGSLTSLPDLIRRATRLAAMMDRGKRPASRMGLDDWPTDSDFKEREQVRVISPGRNEKRQSGLSGMLAAFPPPGQERTPDRERPVSAWPAGLPESEDGTISPSAKGGSGKKRRKCCGLPCWGFILLLIILLIIIAAAVVIPLKFLVLDKPKNSAKATSPSSNSQFTCENGGVAVVQNGGNACICVNGFTGSTCTNNAALGCTTSALTDGTKTANATLGDAIPRLINAAQANFSVPLSSTSILADFNNNNLSCVTENSLVTFSGSDTSQPNVDAQGKGIIIIGNPNSTFISTALSDLTASSTATQSTTIATAPGITTSPSTTASISTTTRTSIPTKTTTSATSTATSTSFTVTPTILDFSRVAMLFILQEENFNSAITAQTALQKFFNSAGDGTVSVASARNISLGGSNTVDLVGLNVDVGNGSVGGTGSAMKRWVERRGRERRVWVVPRNET